MAGSIAHRRRRTALPSIPFLVNLTGARDTAAFGAATRLTPRGGARTMRAAVTLPPVRNGGDAAERFADPAAPVSPIGRTALAASAVFGELCKFPVTRVAEAAV